MPSKKPCRVMVTGAGSGVGQGIVKALRIADLPVTIVSADIDAMNVSLYRADEAVLIPRVESPDALDVIVRLLGDHQINVVLVGSEFDLEFFSVNQKTLQEKTGARVICCPPETVAIANDKWLTAEFLRKQGLPFAESRLVNGADEAVATASEWGFPVVAKARTGTSARHVHVVRSARELQEVWTAIPSPMLQRMVGLPSTELSGEYTCSIFRTASGRVLGPFCARRTLRGGTSWHIEVQRLDEFDSLLLGIGSLLPFEGFAERAAHDGRRRTNPVRTKCSVLRHDGGACPFRVQRTGVCPAFLLLRRRAGAARRPAGRGDAVPRGSLH